MCILHIYVYIYTYTACLACLAAVTIYRNAQQELMSPEPPLRKDVKVGRVTFLVSFRFIVLIPQLGPWGLSQELSPSLLLILKCSSWLILAGTSRE